MPASFRVWAVFGGLVMLLLAGAALFDVASVLQTEPSERPCDEAVAQHGWWRYSHCQAGLLEAVTIGPSFTLLGLLPGFEQPPARVYVPVWAAETPPPTTFTLFVEVRDAATLKLMAALRSQRSDTLAQMAVNSDLTRIQATLRSPVGLVEPLEGEAFESLNRIFGPRLSAEAKVLKQGTRPEVGRAMPILLSVLAIATTLALVWRARQRSASLLDDPST
jgi:hypothetical protein